MQPNSIFDILTFIRGLRQKKLVLHVVLPVLDMTSTCHVKKAVAWVTELMIAALIPVYGLLSFLADV